MSRSAEPSTAEHQQRLLELIRERIGSAGGWLPFSEFMDLALYAPGLGYYSAGSVKLGSAGDFVTGPEVSDLYSACVARQCAEVLAATSGDVLELGAGSGRMAGVVLATLESLGTVPARYVILEVSADLRERQQQHLSRTLPQHLRERVQWLDRLPATPIRGIALANEVLDALPVERIVVRDGTVHALGVGLTPEGALTALERPAAPELAEVAGAVLASLPHTLPDGYTTELSVRTRPWLRALREHIDHGVLLLFDYGLPRAQLYHPERTQGTLRCHFRHRAHDDPLRHVGLQDITAWVDFTEVAEAATAAGFEVLGFATQAAFLLGTGIAIDDASEQSAAARVSRASEARRLLLPGEMGEAFKVLALGVGYDRALSGFSVRDLRDSL